MCSAQPDECTPSVHWRVEWISPVTGKTSVERRDEGQAIDLARLQRSAGFETKLIRIEETEVDF